MNSTTANSTTNSVPQLTVIIPVTERFDDIDSVYQQYKRVIVATQTPFEFIYVLDGEYPSVAQALQQLIEQGERIKIVKLAKWFGEATALTVGFQLSKGNIILTLPAYLQIEPDDIPELISSSVDYDVVVARRWPRKDSIINRIQSRLFHAPIRLLTDYDFQDLGCSVRVIKRRVVDELHIYGDQHRFLPLLAHQKGFKVKELNARQAPQDIKKRLYPVGVYIRRLLDILSIFFLLKFTKKPLRFFGLFGSAIFGLGGLTLIYLAFERLVLGVPLADRPMLLLASLLLVLGIQIFAIGLVGEIIIFTHAKDLKEYTIDEIID